MTRWILALLVLPLLSGCYTIRSKALGTPTAPRGRLVSAEESGMGVLYLTVPELYVRDELASQCRMGRVGGVETTLGMRDFIFVQMWTLRAEGVCERRR